MSLDGETEIADCGRLNDKEIRVIRAFIKDNYKEMYLKWSSMSSEGYYGG